ncbi:hypothetical protein SAMN04488554_1740 [Ruania alba]|uniref:PKD domain-containing protein n=1 Tax=Ruania alba TaxID=648782 RepID=A0A1H5GRW7_9MICO|nr:hypothetical protein SAMN04488554_1740 [Ruania alba]
MSSTLMSLVLVLAAATAPSSDDDGPKAAAQATGSTVVVEIQEVVDQQDAVDEIADEEPAAAGTGGNGDSAAPASPEAVAASVSGDGSVIACQMTPEAPENPFVQACGGEVSDEEAPEDPEEEADEPEPVIITVSASDFAELPLAPAEFGVQPDPADGAWTVVNMDTIAYASDDPQVVSTQVLGFPVAVRATPVEFAWDFGDGSDPLVTTDPGAPYPDHTVAYAYTEPVEEVTVSLTTTWVGEFQVGGQGPWIPIAGTAQTSSESAAFEVVEVTTRLVPGPRTGSS